LGTQGLVSLVQTNLQEIRPVNSKLEFKVLINRLKANSMKNHAVAKDLLENFPDWVIPQMLFEREDVRTGLRRGLPYWEVCRDAAQQDAWYQTFDGLLADVPDDGDDPEVQEVPEPDNAEDLLARQSGGDL
ncbi:MAG: ParA family protein, partial [Acidithiobacillus sp.]